jgi:hypothetical protein
MVQWQNYTKLVVLSVTMMMMMMMLVIEVKTWMDTQQNVKLGKCGL